MKRFLYQNPEKRRHMTQKSIQLGLLICLLFFFAMSMYYANQMNANALDELRTTSYEAHYAAVLVGTEKEFMHQVQEGLERQAEALDVAVETYQTDSVEKAVEKIRMLMIAGVDGLITQGINDATFTSALSEVVAENIPIVLVYTDTLTVPRNGFVGVNPFEMGSKSATLWSKGGIPNGDVIHMTQSLSESGDDQVAKLQILGFMDTLKKHGYANKVIIETTQPTVLSAEGLLAERLLNDKGAIGSVVCTTLSDTLGVTQVIIDLNKVGKIKIIGTGFNAQIAEFIEKGVIHGTLYRDSVEMGGKALNMLHEAHVMGVEDKRLTLDYVDMPVEMVTLDNLDIFRATLKEANQ